MPTSTLDGVVSVAGDLLIGGVMIPPQQEGEAL